MPDSSCSQIMKKAGKMVQKSPRTADFLHSTGTRTNTRDTTLFHPFLTKRAFEGSLQTWIRNGINRTSLLAATSRFQKTCSGVIQLPTSHRFAPATGSLGDVSKILAPSSHPI